MDTLSFTVPGMTCGHCKAAVEGEIGKLTNVTSVAVDLDTCEVAIERCVQAVDVGKAINPAIVKGQIEGGTLQALGWAVLENVVYRDGRVANANMTNCIVPTFADSPELETILIEVPLAPARPVRPMRCT